MGSVLQTLGSINLHSSRSGSGTAKCVYDEQMKTQCALQECHKDRRFALRWSTLTSRAQCSLLEYS
jgi:hypothetical protein